MDIRFLILWLALGLLAAGGCSKVKEMYEDKRYEIKVRTNFDESTDFSSFHTFAHSGMTDRGRKIAATDNKSPLRMRIKEIVNKQLPTDVDWNHLWGGYQIRGLAKGFAPDSHLWRPGTRLDNPVISSFLGQCSTRQQTADHGTG